MYFGPDWIGWIRYKMPLKRRRVAQDELSSIGNNHPKGKKETPVKSKHGRFGGH